MAKKIPSAPSNLKSKIRKPQLLKVLTVEDSEDDVLLIIRELKKGGYDPVYERVETEKAMKKALKEKPWDIILCDYRLPKFDGAKAIALLKETNIDIPLIIVSGTIGEDTAVECMRLGAQDYIMKNNLSRLCPAIKRELEEADSRNKRKQADEALRQSEEKYRTILESIEDGYYEVDLAGNFTFFNDSMCRILGYPPEEMMGMNNQQYTDKDYAKRLYELFAEVYRTGEPARRSDWQIIRKDGIKRIGEVFVSLQKDSSGNPIGFRGISRDVTERKQAEEALRESENKYRLSFENVTDVIYNIDTNLNIISMSPSVERILGYKPEDFVGRPVSDLGNILVPESFNQAVVDIVPLLKGETVPVKVYKFIAKNGTIKHGEVSGSPIMREGRVIGIISVARDITERELADEALLESENKYKSLVNNVPDIIFIIDLEGKITFVSQKWKEILGYESAETINMNVLNFIPEEDRQRAMESIRKGLKGEKITGFQIPIITKSGEKLFFECSFSRVYKDKAVVGAQGTAVDITERKRAESQRKAALEELRKSEENFRLSLDDSPLGVRIVTAEGETLYVNQATLEIYGYDSIEELKRTPLKERYTPERYAEFQIRKEKRKRGEFGPSEYEISIVRKNGEVRHVQVFRKKVWWNGAEQFQIIYQDITEHKQAEEDRKQSFERTRKALSATVQAISITVEMKDPHTAGHQRRVSDLARSMATEMGLSADRQDFVHTVSSIHDIGKISIPSEILNKPTKLTDLEFDIIKTHAQSGYDILKDIGFPWPVADVVLQHHERMDGSGYPQGLKGDDILPEAQILAIADVMEAMVSHRPYRPALGIDFALEEISRNKGILYDAAAVDACLKLFREKSYTLV